MLSSTLPDKRKDAELAVTTNRNRSSSLQSNTSSSSNLVRHLSSASSSSESEAKEEEDEKNPDSQQRNTETINDSGNTIRRNMSSPLHFLIVYNREILCFLTLFLTTYATLHSKYGVRTPYYPIHSKPIFDKESIVEEFHKGQLTPLQTKVSVSGISAILFYAPWSSNSLYVKQYFESLAKVFQNEIYFAAVNCWQPGGECRLQHSKVKSWPVLVVYYPKSLAVQYNGPWQLGPIYRFLVGILRPIKRLHSYKELKLYVKKNSVTVVGFFSKIGGKYQCFYQSAVKWLEYDPLQDVKFTTVVGDVIDDFNIKNESEIQIFYRGERLEENISNWSINSIVNTIKRHTKLLSKYWGGYHRQDNEPLTSHLQKNPTLFYFVKRDYLNDNNTSEAMLNEVIDFELKKFQNKSDSSEARETVSPDSLTASEYLVSRKTEINQTLSYILLDIFMYYKLAFQLGLTNSNFKLQQSTAVIVDNLRESIHFFPETVALSKETLQQFVDDYQSGNLDRNLRNKDLSKSNNMDKNSNNEDIQAAVHSKVNIPEINRNQFNDIMATNKSNNSTSIIAISSTTCAMCSILKLSILRMSKVLQNLPIKFYRIDGNNNDFLWEYTMGQYPTLLIVPKHKINQMQKDDIRVLPYDIEPSEKNLFGFIMANLALPERLLGLLSYCKYSKISNGFYSCLKKTREIIDSILNEQLNLWRNFPKRRKCILINLEVLRQLYYRLLNAKSSADVELAIDILATFQTNALNDNHTDITFSCVNKNILNS